MISRAIPRPPPTRHRSPLHWRVRQTRPYLRRLRLRRLPGPALQSQPQVQVRLRLACFFDAVPGAVTRHSDKTFGMERIEIVCSNCGGHLGHVFKGEGYATPTDERHCVNSVSLKFNKDDPVEGKA